MRALLQRVAEASVTVESEDVGRIGPGLLIFLGISNHDGEDEAQYIVSKTLNLRVFNDFEGKFNRSALDVDADLLIVSQFTLYGDVRKGRRPSFTEAAPTDQAEALFYRTVELFRGSPLKVQTGRFQTHMKVHLVNDGPVTLMVDSADPKLPRLGR